MEAAKINGNKDNKSIPANIEGLLLNPSGGVMFDRWDVMDVPYCSSNIRWTSLDYHAPKAVATEKERAVGKTCLFFVHGSGWQRGDRKDPMRGGPGVASHFTSLGYPVVLTGYSLSRASEMAHLFLNGTLGASLVLMNIYVLPYYLVAVICILTATMWILSRCKVIGLKRRFESWVFVCGGILLMTYWGISDWIQGAFAVVVSFLYAEICERVEQKMWCSWPKNVTDVAKAIAFSIRKVDCDDMVLVGYSAGSHLLMHVLLNSKLMDEYGVQLSKIKGVVLVSGVYDTVHSAMNPCLKFIFWFVWGRNAFRGQNSDASVILSMENKSSETLRLPKLRLICGSLDGPGIAGDNKLLSTMLKENGCDVSVHVLPRKTHFNIMASSQTLELISEFMN